MWLMKLHSFINSFIFMKVINVSLYFHRRTIHVAIYFEIKLQKEKKKSGEMIKSNSMYCLKTRSRENGSSTGVRVIFDRSENSLPCKLNISVNVSSCLLSEAADKGLFFIL